MAKTYSPGAKAPFSGQYERVGPRGGDTNKEITISKGETLPPGRRSGETFKLVDRSRNKSGRG